MFRNEEEMYRMLITSYEERQKVGGFLHAVNMRDMWLSSK